MAISYAKLAISYAKMAILYAKLQNCSLKTEKIIT